MELRKKFDAYRVLREKNTRRKLSGEFTEPLTRAVERTEKNPKRYQKVLRLIVYFFEKV